MFEEDKKGFSPDQHVVAFIEILGFNDILKNNEYERIHTFFNEVSQELYKIRNKNYLWGFHVIEPKINVLSDKIVMHSKLYEGKVHNDLNSLIFKLFIDFSRVLISVALKNQIALRGLINIGDLYSGTAESKNPELIPNGDPLILKDLLNVFSMEEIFPNELKDCLVPKVKIHLSYGEAIAEAFKEAVQINSVGIFMPVKFTEHEFTKIALLSEKLIDTSINKKTYFACNWINWIHANYGSEKIDAIIDFAEEQSDCESFNISGKWESFLDYSNDL